MKRKLGDVNTYKAMGPDGLLNWVLRYFRWVLAGPVAAIINTSLQRCLYASKLARLGVLSRFTE